MDPATPEISGKLTTGEIRAIVNSGSPEKIKSVPEEDLELFYENERQRSLFSPSGLKSLYAGICEKAVDDYKQEHKMALFGSGSTTRRSDRQTELERFIGSDFFLNVTGMRSKEYAIKMIEKGMIKERKRKLRRIMV